MKVLYNLTYDFYAFRDAFCNCLLSGLALNDSRVQFNFDWLSRLQYNINSNNLFKFRLFLNKNICMKTI